MTDNQRIEHVSSAPNAAASWSAGPWSDAEARRNAARGNRRRSVVFGVAFVALLVTGQVWNFSRPAEYRVSIRLQLDVPDHVNLGQSSVSGVATKMQWLTSRSALRQLAERVPQVRQAAAPGDASEHLRGLLQVQQLPGSDVVEVAAHGHEPRLLAQILNALPEVARAELAARQGSEADGRLAGARQELARLEKTAADRRAKLDAFRQRAGVVAEREDNDAVARTKGLAQALNVATEKEAAAAARVEAINQALAGGRLSTQGRADATLSGLESRAAQVREELREMERTYTPEFMAMDPKARGARTRLAELERQITQQRGAVQRAALQSASEEHAAAAAQVERLRARLAESKPALRKTNAMLAEAKVLEDDLAQVEKARREMLERVARLEANTQRRVASISVVEAAVVPSAPLHPQYTRDAGLVLLAAFVAALSLMGTVEAFHRAPPAPATPGPTVVVAGPWQTQGGPGALGGPGAPAASLAAPGPAPVLAAPLSLLDQPQAAALLAAADGPVRRLCAFGLLGLTLREVAALRAEDFTAGGLDVRGAAPRRVPLPAWMNDAAAGVPSGEEEVAALIVSTALDAGLPEATTLGFETLRNTCIDWLLGQGARFADLGRLVGPVAPAVLRAFGARYPAGPRPEGVIVDPLMPALRLDPSADRRA